MGKEEMKKTQNCKTKYLRKLSNHNRKDLNTDHVKTLAVIRCAFSTYN